MKRLNRKQKLLVIANLVMRLDAKIDALDVEKTHKYLVGLKTGVENQLARLTLTVHASIEAQTEVSRHLSRTRENAESSMRQIQTAFQIASSIEKNAEAIVKAMKGGANGIGQ